jgi:cytochrome c biogenesis protein CcmG/thiol:disulfide interchange protein DsbE
VAKAPDGADQEFSASDRSSARDISSVLWVVVPIAIVGLLVFGFLSSDRGRPQPGEAAPDLRLTLLDGSQIALRDLRGQVVVLNFWASWCDPCRREAPELQQVWEQYRDRGIAFVGVTFHDAKGASQRFVERYGLTYPNGVDERGRISQTYGVVAVPETFIIDRDGAIASVHVGEIDAETLVKEIEELVTP